LADSSVLTISKKEEGGIAYVSSTLLDTSFNTSSSKEECKGAVYSSALGFIVDKDSLEKSRIPTHTITRIIVSTIIGTYFLTISILYS